MHVLVEDAAFPSVLAPAPDGGLLYGERLTGRIRRVEPGGRLRPEPVARVEVSTEGHRGLLGLAVDGDGRIFASWTDPRRRLVIGRVSGRSVEPVWVGPQSKDMANGGRIAFSPDGRLVVGIGDLLEPELVDDPDSPHGKLLALDPQGPPEQRPEVISAGWNNPFAFAFTSSGLLWVADNAPGSRPERIARGDLRGQPTSVTELDGKRAPAGLAALSGGRLAVCGYVSGTLEVFEVVAGGRAQPYRDPAATDCTLDVATLADGRLAYANQDRILTIEP